MSKNCEEWVILDFANIFYALAAGAAFSWALVLFYRTLQISEASRSVPFVGALVPIATLIFSFPLGLEKLTGQHFLAFLFLVGGGFLIGLLLLAKNWREILQLNRKEKISLFLLLKQIKHFLNKQKGL